MGTCSSCLKGDQPDAAERRRLEIENRGIEDPAKMKRQQKYRAKKMELLITNY